MVVEEEVDPLTVLEAMVEMLVDGALAPLISKMELMVPTKAAETAVVVEAAVAVTAVVVVVLLVLIILLVEAEAAVAVLATTAMLPH